MRKLIRRLQQWKHHRELRQDLKEELEFHRQLRERDILESGVSPRDARAASYRAMGNTTRSLEDARGVWIWPWLEALWQDASYAVRAFRQRPLFMAVVVLMLALGIGANTALFSVVDAVVARAPGVGNPEELVFLNWVSSGWTPEGGAVPAVSDTAFHTSPGFSLASYGKLRSSTHTLSGLAAYGGVELHRVESGGTLRQVTTQAVTGNYFETLVLTVATGRMIDDRDNAPEAAPVVVLTHRGWKNRFGSEPGVVGKQVRFPDSGTPATIVGVTAEEFQGMGGLNNYPEMLVPFSVATRIDLPVTKSGDPMLWRFRLVGRMRPGIQLENVRDELQGVFEQAAIEASGRAVAPQGLKLEALSGMRGDPMPAWYKASGNDDLMKTLLPIPAFLLVIVCMNVASLLMARAAARRNEIGVRLSIGAGRLRIVRQLLTESVVVAIFGGAAGLALAYLGRGLFSFFLRDDIDLLRIDSHVLVFTATVAILSGLLFGLTPALHATRAGIHSVVKQAGAFRSRSWFAKGLLIAQVAMSFVLVASGSLLFRTAQEFASLDAGLDAGTDAGPDAGLDGRNLVIWEIPPARVPGRPGVFEMDRIAMYQQKIGAVAGVSATTRWAGAGPGGRAFAVEPNYFTVMGIPLLAGRGFGDDEEGATGIAVVNEAMVRRYFPDMNPIGKEIPSEAVSELQKAASPPEGAGITIIGVARDTTLTPPLHKFGYKPHIAPAVYVPAAAGNPVAVTLGIRTSVDPATAIPSILAAGTGPGDGTAPSASRSVPETYAEYRERVFARLFSLEHSLALILNVFGLLALVMVSAGLYGVISCAVSRRTKELGIRIAVGAPPRAIAWLVQKELMPILALGLPIGLLMSLPVMILIRREVFGLATRDLPALLIALLLVGAVTVFAAWLPARRAARINPATALNHEMS